MQCHVIAMGRPRRSATRVASQANGDTTPVCTWATSKRRPARRRRSSGGAHGLIGSSTRQSGGQSVDGDAVDDRDLAVHLTVGALAGSEDLDLVPQGDELTGEVVRLHLDAAEPRQIAVGEQGHLHGLTLSCGKDGSMPRTLLAFHAHPDEEALLTSGTMARAAAEGHRVVLVVATDGELGLASQEYAADGALAGRRMAELRRSAAALGVARVEHLGYADSGLGPEVAPDPPGTKAPCCLLCFVSRGC